MKKALLGLRILETIFLIGIIFGFYRKADQIMLTFNALNLGFHINATVNSSPAILSTAILGYLFSLLGTLFFQRDQSSLKSLISLIVAALGFISLTNEMIRFFAGYDFQFLITIPVLLVPLDWYLFKQEIQAKNSSSNEPVTS